jgi:hypothetical protein
MSLGRAPSEVFMYRWPRMVFVGYRRGTQTQEATSQDETWPSRKARLNPETKPGVERQRNVEV